MEIGGEADNHSGQEVVVSAVMTASDAPND